MPRLKFPGVLSSDGSANPDYLAGDKPQGGDSGVSGDTSWNAPQGLVDAQPITLTHATDTYSAPDKQVYLGHGIGWMYDNPLDTTMQNVTISQADGDIVYEYTDKSNRQIKLKDGIRVLESFTHPEGGGGFTSGGNLTYETGVLWPAGTCTYMYSRTRGTIGVGAGGPDTQYQWKQDRMRSFSMANPQPYNSAYLVGWHYGNRVVLDNGGTKGLGRSALLDGTWTTLQWTWKHNTPDVADGSMREISMKTGETGITDNLVTTGDVADAIESAYPERPKCFIIQDYIGSRNGTTVPYDITIDRTDLYWKVNGDSFMLCDNADPALITEMPVQLVPTAFPAANKVTLNLWSAGSGTYAGKFIHRRDREDNLIEVIAL